MVLASRGSSTQLVSHGSTSNLGEAKSSKQARRHSHPIKRNTSSGRLAGTGKAAFAFTTLADDAQAQEEAPAIVPRRHSKTNLHGFGETKRPKQARKGSKGSKGSRVSLNELAHEETGNTSRDEGWESATDGPSPSDQPLARAALLPDTDTDTIDTRKLIDAPIAIASPPKPSPRPSNAMPASGTPHRHAATAEAARGQAHLESRDYFDDKHSPILAGSPSLKRLLPQQIRKLSSSSTIRSYRSDHSTASNYAAPRMSSSLRTKSAVRPVLDVSQAQGDFHEPSRAQSDSPARAVAGPSSVRQLETTPLRRASHNRQASAASNVSSARAGNQSMSDLTHRLRNAAGASPKRETAGFDPIRRASGYFGSIKSLANLAGAAIVSTTSVSPPSAAPSQTRHPLTSSEGPPARPAQVTFRTPAVKTPNHIVSKFVSSADPPPPTPLSESPRDMASGSQRGVPRSMSVASLSRTQHKMNLQRDAPLGITMLAGTTHGSRSDLALLPQLPFSNSPRTSLGQPAWPHGSEVRLGEGVPSPDEHGPPPKVGPLNAPAGKLQAQAGLQRWAQAIVREAERIDREHETIRRFRDPLQESFTRVLAKRPEIAAVTSSSSSSVSRGRMSDR
ncbi:uncharacterized protein L969DRAFT_90356 [Mixia osmundae IAM 14324]|nr:uncharacterized protein L969DRAFT_90356 [Mixia osmundae IAM 14324]KEI36823.1 hypothetical protein L969DRAFT_90356 [Mixia osmundae IAM 14324]